LKRSTGMNKSTKKAADPADRIPTLTEIVAEAALADAISPVVASVETPSKTAKTPAAKAPELPKDLVQTVERLVYKALYRQLPPLSKEISTEILNILEKQLLDKKSR
jgi:hypothetical protein